jgi:hypothetical protein
MGHLTSRSETTEQYRVVRAVPTCRSPKNNVPREITRIGNDRSNSSSSVAN